MPIQKNRYLSILKQKAGEIDAVRQLAANIWDRWNPLFELLSLELEEDENENDLVARIVRGLKRSCREGTMIFVDFEGVELRDQDGGRIVEQVLDQIVADNLIPVPVIRLDSTQPVLDGIRNFTVRNEGCCMVRVFFDEFTQDLSNRITAVIGGVNAAINKSFLLVDMQEITENVLDQYAIVLPPLLGVIPSLNHWLSVTIAGTGYPRTLDIAAASSALIPRTEWEFFNRILPQVAPLVKRIDFGDYAISNPQLVDFDPVRMQISAKIVYTTDNSWLAYKGRSLKRYGGDQTHAMCQDLIGRPEFQGAAFSYGDDYIASCAVRATGCGNPQTWKKVGTNHHVTFVANQVANQLGF